MSRPRRIAIALTCAAVVVALIGGAAWLATRDGTAQETTMHSDRSVAASDLLSASGAAGVSLADTGISDELRVLSLNPTGSNAVGFTYYDVATQDRIAAAVQALQNSGAWTADSPLAILNPFGTGSNGLYLYFETDRPATVSYTIRAEGAPDFTRIANDVAVEGSIERDAEGGTRVHSFQMIGLVPGATNHVALTVGDPQGESARTLTFSIDTPATRSGYPTALESADGASTQPLSDGLFALMRANGYLGYGFFFDNDGVLRYEMVTDGFALDRVLSCEDGTLVCTSTQSVCRIDGLGRVRALYTPSGYTLHHDINYGADGSVVALAEKTGRETVEDVVIEIDLAAGAVTELVDFSELMADYKNAYTHAILPTSVFSWQAGEWDWIHLNSVEYFAEDDAIIVSSRETSTIMKVAHVHSQPEIVYFAGDPAIWAGTAYEDCSLDPVGDFTPQYGQHAVQYDGAGPTAHSYYLLMYDNNYWTSCTRDDFQPDLAGTDTGTDLYNGTASYVYRYLVDEEAGTFELASSFPVPYSSIVSNAFHAPRSDNYAVNSGVANIYGEYDADGTLIRQFSYPCDMQGYRAFKDTFEGFWFAANAA